MSLTSLARSGGTSGTTMKLMGVAPGTPPTSASQAAKDALQTIATFIPSEVVTIYLAAESAIRGKLPEFEKALTAVAGSAAAKVPPLPPWAIQLDEIVLGLCMLLTIFWIYGVYYIESRGAGKPGPFPWWKLVAGLVAFVVYALGTDVLLLNGPSASPATSVAAAFGVIFIAPLLTFVDRIIKASPWSGQAVSAP